MDYAEFLDALILDGLDAARSDYSLPPDADKLAGAMEGFISCKGKSPDELVSLLSVAIETRRVSGDSDYWRLRCREIGVQWVCDCVSAYLASVGRPVITMPLIAAVRKAEAILGRHSTPEPSSEAMAAAQEASKVNGYDPHIEHNLEPVRHQAMIIDRHFSALRAERAALLNGERVILPVSKAHAEAMASVAMHYLREVYGAGGEREKINVELEKAWKLDVKGQPSSMLWTLSDHNDLDAVTAAEAKPAGSP